MEENNLAVPLLERKLGPPNTEGLQEKQYLWMGGGGRLRLYTFKNKNANTDYQKVVRVGNQKREIYKLQSESFFIWDSLLTIFYTESFQVPPEKNYLHLKCQFQPKIPIWSKSLLYEASKKMATTPSPKGCVNYEVYMTNLKIAEKTMPIWIIMLNSFTLWKTIKITTLSKSLKIACSKTPSLVIFWAPMVV